MVGGEKAQIVSHSTENTWECIRMYPITAGSEKKAVEGALAAISEGEKEQVCLSPGQPIQRHPVNVRK